MYKVTIEITGEGWETTIYNGNTRSIETFKKTRTGATSEGEVLEDNVDVDRSLSEAISDLNIYDVMQCL